ncbi:MAG: HslU--HslV peptidase ATPase subunit, partial [Eubacteriaceae bacterium]|nr:HslU--HslV peptidase ATPase subunit [Eubacteriaceae bacterium]
LKFEDDALKAIAAIAFSKNEEEENIGARRLHTVFEELLEDISFYASDYDQDEFIIDQTYVESVFKSEEKERSYAKYLL